MCFIIDINTFSSVFNPKAEDHQDFRPVLLWVCQGKGKLVYGGQKYKSELKALTKYLRIIRQLQTAGKIVVISDEEVDQAQNTLEQKINHKDFDDPHLIAIVVASRCLLVCSKDKRAYSFIKDSTLYPKPCKPPRIYSRATNADLLCDQNIADCCKPATKVKGLHGLLH